MGLRLEYKATGAATTAAVESGVLEADKTTGIVEALVSVTGLVDEDNDEILPGSYAATLTKRRPKGIFHHDWHKWVAKTLDIAELMPGDPRLPKTTRSGAPWPESAGGLWVKCQFNLATQTGKEAFSNIEFFENETEWSIGYKVRPGNARKTPDGVRRIKAVDLYEYSPVLFGAAPLSGTLSVKELTGQDEEEEDGEEEPPEDDAEGDTPPDAAGDDGAPPAPPADEDETLHAVADAVIDQDEEPPGDLDALLQEPEEEEATDDTTQDTTEDIPPGLSLFDDLPPEGAGKAASGPLEGKGGAPGVADTPGDAEAVQRLKNAYTKGKLAVQIRWGEPGDFMRCVKIASKYLSPDKAKGFCANRHKEAIGSWPGREGGKKDAYDPSLEVGPDAGYLDPDGLEAKSLRMTGTLEDLRDKLREAVEQLYIPRRDQGGAEVPANDREYHWVCVEGTWLDHVVVTHEHAAERDSYSIPYMLTPGGDVVLGEPQPVVLTVTPVVTPGTLHAMMASKADTLTHLALSVQAGAGAAVETKAGRVFSAANEQRLRQAMGLLINALKSAGLDVLADTPAPAAPTEGKVTLSGDLLRRRQALTAFARDKSRGNS